MDLSQKNFKQMLIGKDVDRTASVTPATLAIGEIALFSTSGVEITSSNYSSFTKAVFMQGKGSGAIEVSDIITKANIKSIKGSNGFAKQEQVTHVGFNGTSGAIDLLNDTSYLLRFNFKSLLVSSNRGEIYKSSSWASPVSGVTQTAAAEGLQKSIIGNFARESSEYVKAELIINRPGAVIGTGTDSAGTIKATKGSKLVTGWTDVDNATGTAALAIGDVLRFGTALTSPVYKIASINTTGNTLTLTVPFQGSTELFANAGIEKVLASTVLTADFGIQITGVSETASVGRFLPSVTMFDLITFDSMGTTPITKSTGPKVGNNTAEIVAEREFLYKGNQGDTFRYGREAFSPTYFAESILYDAISISWTESVENGALLNIPHKELEIVIPATRANDQYSANTNGIAASVAAFFGANLAL